MSEHLKEAAAKTVGGATTYAVTYATAWTIQDLQAYSIIFASIATGLYYLVVAYLAYKKGKDDGSKKP